MLYAVGKHRDISADIRLRTNTEKGKEDRERKRERASNDIHGKDQVDTHNIHHECFALHMYVYASHLPHPSLFKICHR